MIYKSKIIKIILIIILAIYIFYIWSEFFNIKTKISMNIIKYISILLCFNISLLCQGNGINKLDSRLLQIGMFFTIIADLFLVVLDYHIPGVLTFCIVQVIYIARYTGGRIQYIGKNLIKLFISILSIYFLYL